MLPAESVLCMAWQPPHSATPPEWNAQALVAPNVKAAAAAILRNFIFALPPLVPRARTLAACVRRWLETGVPRVSDAGRDAASSHGRYL
jgi:hypothetical protein